MKLTYKELKERDVINVNDGRCLGRISDLTLIFPEGRLVGITVPGKNQNFISRIFDRSSLYIEIKNIIKIGGDVILVKLNSDGGCTNKKKKPPCSPCEPPCSSNNEADSYVYSDEDEEY